MGKKINIRPTTSVYATYKNIKYDPWTAIAEFVDNSTQSYYDNAAKLQATKYWDGLEIEIIYERNASGDRLIIRDNAYGMDFNDFQRAIILDSPPKKASRSEFGMGLKTAACWFGTNWSVESTELGSNIKYVATIDVEALHKYKNEEIEVQEVEVNPKEHGTVITIWNLNRTIMGRQIGKTKDQLRGMYRVDIRSGDIRITYNGEELMYEEPPVLEEQLPDGNTKRWRQEIAFEIPYKDSFLHVNGFIGIRETASTSAAGFALIRRGRVIVGGYENAYRPEEIFEKPNSFVYQRLFGELNLDDWPVTQTKDAFDWYNGLEDELIEKLNEVCKEYKKKAKDYRVGKKTNIDDTVTDLVNAFSNAGIIEDASVETIEDDPALLDDSPGNEENNDGSNSSDEIQGDDNGSAEDTSNTENQTRDIEVEGPTGKSISFKTPEGEYKFNLILRKNDPMQSWLSITPVGGNEYNIAWNIRHPFFKPYIDEPAFLSVMEQFVFALSLAEIESMSISTDGNVPAATLRMKMNDLLKEVAKGGKN